MYKRFVLDNGLTVAMDRRAAKKVVLLVGVKAGLINEDEKKSGVGHFVEHMLFKSNFSRTARQVREDLEDGGAEVQAFSGSTDMYFYIKALSSKLPKIVEIVYQAVANLDFELKEFSLEKKNILSEMFLWPEQPMNYAYEELFIPSLFRKTAFARSVVGAPKSIRYLKRRDLVNFKQRWYVPNNIVIVVCGGFDEKELEEKVASTFGSLKPYPVPMKKLDIKVKNERTELFEEREGIEHAYMHLGYRIPGTLSRDINKLRVLAGILGGGISSRLFRELRDKRGLGYVIDCGTGGLAEIGIFYTAVTIFEPTPKKFKATLGVILNEFEKLKTDLVEERELQRAKDLILSDYYDEMERIESKALDMLEAEMQGVPYSKFKKFPFYIQSVSAQGVRAAARKYLNSNYTLTALVPRGFKK